MLLSKSGLHLGWVKLVIIYSAWGKVLGKWDTELDWTSPISKKLLYFKNYFDFIWTTTMCAGELGVWCPQKRRQCEFSLRSCSGAGCHWLSFWGAGGHLLCPSPVKGTAVICFSGGNKLIAFDRNWGVCEIDVCLGFFPQSYWTKSSTRKCTSSVSNINVSKLFLSLSSSLPYFCFIQTQPKWTSFPAGTQSALVLWTLLALQVTGSHPWSRGAAAVT